MKIRASGEDYIEGVFVLQKKHDTVRSVALARHMEVSKASVSHAVSALRKTGLLVMDSNHVLRLTDAGRELAILSYPFAFPLSILQFGKGKMASFAKEKNKA